MKITAKIVGSIKEVKILGMSNTWLNEIQQLRIHELEMSKKFRMLIVYMNVLGQLYSHKLIGK